MATNFFVAKNETVADLVMSPEMLMKVAPDYYAPRFDAIAELRANDDGSLYRGAGFRHVASLVNVPLLAATRMIDPDFLKDKRRFYGFLDRHPEYCAYQRRRHVPGTIAHGILAPGPLPRVGGELAAAT